MLLRTVSNFLLSTRHCHKHLRKLKPVMSKAVIQKAIIRYNSKKSSIHVTFDLSHCNKTRTFNLNRNAGEELSVLLNRMQCNIISYFNRKIKGKRKREEVTVEIAELKNYVVRLFESSDVLHENLDNLDKESLTEVSLTSTCLEAMATDSERKLLQLGDYYYRLDVDPPTVVAMSLPSNIMTGYLLYPNYLDLTGATPQSCDVRWFVSKDTFENHQTANIQAKKMQFQELEPGFLMKPTTDMIGKLLKVVVEPRAGDRAGDPYEAVARALVTEAPAGCPYLARHRHTTEHTPAGSVRVVSYNLLADTYASTSFSAEALFSTCPGYALDGFYRKQLLIDEIIGYHADIVCLQEVDADLFEYDLSRVLPLQAAMQGCYAGKYTLSTKEGEAIFYNTDKFRLHSTSNYRVAEELTTQPALATLWGAVQQLPQLEELFTTRTTVLQVCVLESLRPAGIPGEDGRPVTVVGNSHFYFHPDADNVRLLQSVVCFAVLDQVVSELRQQGHRVSVLMCGDLNSTPDTGVYQLATKGAVEETHHGWGADQSKGLSFKHSLPLASACGTPEYTNYVQNFNGCLDWIFYQTDRFTVEKVVELPSHEVVTAHTALPSPVIPSDHLALIADLTVT